jgi:hypothetical protein
MIMGNALLLTQLLLQAATQVQQFGGLLAKAHAEGRDVTDDELSALVGADDAAKARLDALIAAKGPLG